MSNLDEFRSNQNAKEVVRRTIDSSQQTMKFAGGNFDSAFNTADLGSHVRYLSSEDGDAVI